MATQSIPYRKRRPSSWHTGLTEDQRLDEAQRLMVERAYEAFAAMWPSDALRPPKVLNVLHLVIWDLLDYSVRTEDGRARKRKRLVERYTSPDGPYGVRADLTSMVPALLAALTDADLGLEADGLADAVEAWLASS